MIETNASFDLGRRAQIQRTDAFVTNRIGIHVQVLAKRDGRRAVEQVGQGCFSDITQGLVKEAGAHGAISFDHSRDPGCIAAHGREPGQAVKGGVIVVNTTDFVR